MGKMQKSKNANTLCYENNGLGGQYLEEFNQIGGYIVRHNLFDGCTPFQRDFPATIGIGIMGDFKFCKNEVCTKQNMSLERYKKIIDEACYKTFQVVLDGQRDPDIHEDFEEILKYTRDKNIIPSFTTSGLTMTPEKAKICKKYCGVVGVNMYSRLKDTIPFVACRRTSKEHIYKSENDIPVIFTLGNIYSCYKIVDGQYVINGDTYEWDELHHIHFGKAQKYKYYRVYDESVTTINDEPCNYTMNAIKMLLDAGMKTNIYFALNKYTIKEAIIRIKYNGFPFGINAVIFSLGNSVGQYCSDESLSPDDPLVKEFFDLISRDDFFFKIGFDLCSIQSLVKLCDNVGSSNLNMCEGARFSMHISSDMKASPCSFDVKQKYVCDISNNTISSAWNSKQFEEFRNQLRNMCSGTGCTMYSKYAICPTCSKLEVHI